MKSLVCDICKKEIGKMRLRYEVKTIYPFTKDPSVSDWCNPCYLRAQKYRKNNKLHDYGES